MGDDDLKGKPLALDRLLDYQDGAVVSRALIDKDAGTITLFSFDKAEGLSEHTAPYDAFVQVLEGTAEVTIDGASNSVKKGECIIMPAHKPHGLRAVERFKMLLTMIRA